MKITEVNLRQLKHSTLFPNRTFAHCPPQLQPNTLQPPPNTITTTLFPLNQVGTLTLACTLSCLHPKPKPFQSLPTLTHTSLLQLPWSPSVMSHCETSARSGTLPYQYLSQSLNYQLSTAQLPSTPNILVVSNPLQHWHQSVLKFYGNNIPQHFLLNVWQPLNYMQYHVFKSTVLY